MKPTDIYGKNGANRACALGLENKMAIRIHTFGKAIGIHGACVVGSITLIQYLINFARPFIFTAAPSSASFYFYHMCIQLFTNIRSFTKSTQIEY